MLKSLLCPSHVACWCRLLKNGFSECLALTGLGESVSQNGREWRLLHSSVVQSGKNPERLVSNHLRNKTKQITKKQNKTKATFSLTQGYQESDRWNSARSAPTCRSRFRSCVAAREFVWAWKDRRRQCSSGHGGLASQPRRRPRPGESWRQAPI